jgi:hypothetical protein
MRFAVLYDGGLADWQRRCVDGLLALPGVTLVASVGTDPASIARLRELAPEFILCFADGPLPADLIALPRHGVWRFIFGDWVNFRGTPAGFWEVYEGCPASSALLARLHSDPDMVEVLREGCVRTELLSVRKNRQQLLERFTHWPAQACRELLAGASAAIDASAGAGPGVTAPNAATGASDAAGAKPALRRGARPRPPPVAWQRAVLFARIAVRAAAEGLRSLFRHDQWNVGIVDQPIEQFLKAGRRAPINWLPATRRSEFRADPFGALHDGRPTILCEHFSYRDNLGYIVALDAAGERLGVAERARPGERAGPGEHEPRVQIGPEPAVHLSYPFLLEDGGRRFCVPESSASKEIAIYEALDFPNRWTKRATLVAEGAFVDATPFRHDDRWWMMASDVARKGANSELHLWYAETLFGPWTAHPGNPVKIDVHSARPAGAPFSVDGVLYRPAQDCSSGYGARVVLNRVSTLTPTAFREEVVATVDPDPRGRYPAGLHTLSRFGERTLIDGKRSVFVAAEFFRVLAHYLT